MRGPINALILGCFAVALVGAPPTGQQSLGDKVIAFCQEHKGQQVGDGECASLANQALRSAGAKGRGPDSPSKGDYTWAQDLAATEG